jgi:hypothetical protein
VLRVKQSPQQIIAVPAASPTSYNNPSRVLSFLNTPASTPLTRHLNSHNSAALRSHAATLSHIHQQPFVLNPITPADPSPSSNRFLQHHSEPASNVLSRRQIDSKRSRTGAETISSHAECRPTNRRNVVKSAGVFFLGADARLTPFDGYLSYPSLHKSFVYPDAYGVWLNDGCTCTGGI